MIRKFAIASRRPWWSKTSALPSVFPFSILSTVTLTKKDNYAPVSILSTVTLTKKDNYAPVQNMISDICSQDIQRKKCRPSKGIRDQPSQKHHTGHAHMQSPVPWMRFGFGSGLVIHSTAVFTAVFMEVQAVWLTIFFFCFMKGMTIAPPQYQARCYQGTVQWFWEVSQGSDVLWLGVGLVYEVGVLRAQFKGCDLLRDY